MGLHNFQPSPGSTTRKRIVARGIGSGMGKTATRGTKGQKARRQVHPNFEGGQTPIQRRLPVKKGFRNVNHKEYAIINLDDLERFEDGATITPEALLEAGIINKVLDGVKILGFGQLTKKVTVQAHRYSASAREAIAARGGVAQVLSKSGEIQGEEAPASDPAYSEEAPAS